MGRQALRARTDGRAAAAQENNANKKHPGSAGGCARGSAKVSAMLLWWRGCPAAFAWA